MNIQLKLAWRYLWGRKTRAILTTFSITLGVMLIFGFSSIVPALANMVKQDIEAAKVDVDIIVTRDGHAFFPEGLQDEIAQVPGAMFVIGTLERNLDLPPAEQITMLDGRTMTTLEIKAARPLSADNPIGKMVQTLGDELLAGRPITIDDTGQPVAIISEALAAAKGIEVGDTLTLPSAQGQIDLEVVGFTAGNRSISSEFVYTTLTAAQTIFNTPGQIDTIIGLIDPAMELTAVQDQIRDLLPPGYNFGSYSAGGSAFDSAIQMADMIFNLFGVLVLAMAGLIMFNTFRTVVVERKRDIGMLRAIGATRRMVTRTILAEGIIQGVLGTTIGLALGTLFAQALIPVMNGYFDAFFPNSSLGAPVFSGQSLLTAVFLGIGIPVVSGLLPARQAGKLTPMEALRPFSDEEEVKQTRRTVIFGVVLVALAIVGLLSGNVGGSTLGMLLFFVCILVVSPLLIRPVTAVFGRLLVLLFAREGHVAERNLGRQPSRAAITASTVGVGMAIIIALSGMVTSALNGIISYMDVTLDADYMLIPETLFLGATTIGAESELAQTAANIDGIEQVTTIRQSSIVMDELGTVNLMGIDPVTYPQVTSLYFIEGDSEDAFKGLENGRTVIINSFVASQLQLKPGDTITLNTVNGTATYEVVAEAADYLNVKTPALYTSQANLVADFNLHNDTIIMMDSVPGANEQAIENALTSLTQHYSQFSLFSFDSLRATQVEGMQGASSVYSILMAVLAIPSLLALANTLTVNVLERTREIGVLRAIGSMRKQVRRMVMAESLLLSALGIAIGILVGLWMSWIMVESLSFIGIPVPFFFPYTGIVVAIAVGLIFGVIAALAPARRASKQNIITALAYE